MYFLNKIQLKPGALNSLVGNKGIALMLTLVFMLILSMLGAMLLQQSRTTIKVSSGLRDYEQAFNLADGGCLLCYNHITTRGKIDSSMKNANQTNVNIANLPSYMNASLSVPSSRSKYRSNAKWMGYDNKPLPGWMLNWQGYSNFHTVNLKCSGGGNIPDREGDGSVFSLLLYLTR
jgi:hypothetical protein